MRQLLRFGRSFLVTAVLAVPGLALAGGVVTDGRTGVRMTFDVADVPHVDLLGGPLGPVEAKPISTKALPGTPRGGTKSDGELSRYELQQIADGLITTEEASAGCGGATAGRGDAGLVPLLAAGLALLAVRRRKA